MRGKERGAIQVEEAYRILKLHGYPFDHRASDERLLGGVKIAIGKDRHLVRHANDTVGLAEWYPNRKKPKAGKGAEADAPEEEATDDTNESDEVEVGKRRLALPSESTK